MIVRGSSRASYDVVPFRPERNATIDTLRWARKRMAVTSLVEVDVTRARAAIRNFRKETGKELSFTAWVVSCVARAAAEHPRVHAMRRGRRLLLFHEVDVAVVVERAMNDAVDETLPMPVVIRNACEKSLREVHEEIRRAQIVTVEQGAVAIDRTARPWLQSMFFRMPWWLRDVVLWRWLLRSPARMKQAMGSIIVTATGMSAPGVLAWGIPLSVHPLAICIGGIAQRSTASGTADVLALTVVFDHAVTDGGPVGRFIHRLHDLMTRGAGLDGLESGAVGFSGDGTGMSQAIHQPIVAQ